jgi:hypothetical protein
MDDGINKKFFRVEAKLDLLLGLLIEMRDRIPNTTIDAIEWDKNRNKITQLLLEDKLDGIYVGD